MGSATSPRHFPSFGAHAHLGGGFRIPSETSNIQHQRHLAPREGPTSYAAQPGYYDGPVLRSCSPEQLMADCHLSQAAAEDLYASASIGTSVVNHVYTGQGMPPPVLGVGYQGDYADAAAANDASPRAAASAATATGIGAWSTTTFRPNLAVKHSGWDHDGTDFTSGYVTQKLARPCPAAAAAAAASKVDASGRNSSSSRPGSHNSRRGAATSATARPAAAGAAAAAQAQQPGWEDDCPSQEQWYPSELDACEQDLSHGSPDANSSYQQQHTTTAAAYTNASRSAPEAVQATSGTRRPPHSPREGAYPASWFSHTPVAVLAAEREATRQQEAMYLLQFHPTPGAKHPERSVALHRATLGSKGRSRSAGSIYGSHLRSNSSTRAYDWQQQQQQQQQRQQEQLSSPSPTGRQEPSWMAQQMLLQRHDRIDNSAYDRASTCAAVVTPVHDPSTSSDSEQAQSSTADWATPDITSELSGRRCSSEPSEDPESETAAAPAGTAESADGRTAEDRYDPDGSWQISNPRATDDAVSADAAGQQPRDRCSGDTATGRAPWWHSNARVAGLVQQMLESPSKAQYQQGSPLPDSSPYSWLSTAAAAAAPVDDHQYCSNSSSSWQSSPGTSSMASRRHVLLQDGFASPSQTWAVYCKSLQAALAETGHSGDPIVTQGGTSSQRQGSVRGTPRSASSELDWAVEAGLRSQAVPTLPVEQQRSLWVGELLDRPLKERLRLLELHSWNTAAAAAAASAAAAARKQAAPSAAASEGHKQRSRS